MSILVIRTICMLFSLTAEWKHSFNLTEEILDAKTTAHLIMDAAGEKKAENLLLLDVHGVTTITDYFVICEGTNDRQLNAIAENILDELKKTGQKPALKEGTPQSGWILLDYGYVVVHIFTPERRAYYQLEELWNEAPTVVKML